MKIKIDNDTENDNQKETLTDLYVSNLFKRGLSNYLDVKIKSILALKICKLIPLEYFKLFLKYYYH